MKLFHSLCSQLRKRMPSRVRTIVDQRRPRPLLRAEELEPRYTLSVAPTIGSASVLEQEVFVAQYFTAVAQDVTVAVGSIAEVNFFWDQDSDGQIDASDTLLGAGAPVETDPSYFALNIDSTVFGDTPSQHQILVQAKSDAEIVSDVKAVSFRTVGLDIIGHTTLVKKGVRNEWHEVKP